MMTVDFREHFWGERNGGFELLYRNCKQSQATAKELVEFVRERSQIEESYSKLLAKLASSRLLGSASSVAPLWAALRSSTEKAASVHSQLAHQLSDSVKDIQRYADEQHKRQKSIKDEEATTMEAVQALQHNTILLAKAREAHDSRKTETNDLKRKKAFDDYRLQSERHEIARVNFIQKMSEACARFQVLEENHLSGIKSFIDCYIHTLTNSYASCASMCSELQSNVDALSIEELLTRFCRDRGTGRDKPEPHKMLQDTPPLSGNPLQHSQNHSQSSEDVFRSSTNSIPGLGGAISQQQQQQQSHPPPAMTHQSSQSTLYEFLGRNLTLRGRNRSTSKNENNSSSSGDIASNLNAAVMPPPFSATPLVDEDGFSVPPPPPPSSAAPSKLVQDSSSDESSDDEVESHKKIVVRINPISEAKTSNSSLAQPTRLVSPPAKMTPVLSPEFNGNRTPPILADLPKTIIPRPPSRRSVDRSSPSPMTRAESVTSIGSVSTERWSRGPSPLTLGYGDTIPIAVAFQEVVHASFRGAEEGLCQVRIFGDMKMCFPSGILSVLLSHPNPPQLSFSLGNLPLENLSPNSLLVSSVEEQPGTFRMDMAELLSQLKRLHDAHPGQAYFNVDLMKYSLAGGPGASSAPLHLVTYWNCDSTKSDLKVDYLYNATDKWAQRPCHAIVTVTLPPSAAIRNVHSKPPCSWNSASKKVSWKIVNIKAGSILARFEHEGPLHADPPGEVAAQFSIEDACFSDASFTLAPACGYRVSLVKKKIISGRYTAVM